MTDKKDKTITIRLDAETHKRIKIRSAEIEMTITDYLLELVEKDLKRRYEI